MSSETVWAAADGRRAPVASWLITFLSGHSHWKEKAAEEVRRLVTEHATHLHSTASTSTLAEQDPAFARMSGPPEAEAAFSPHARQTPPSCTDTDADSHRRERTESSSSTATAPSPLSSLAASLASVPLDAWENHTPTLDALIRETLRVAEPHVAMRQYLPPLHHHPDEKAAHAHTLYLGGKAVPPGAFVMYPFSDVHLSAEIYKDPWRWDPARAEMNLKAPYAYVGMGAGAYLRRSAVCPPSPPYPRVSVPPCLRVPVPTRAGRGAPYSCLYSSLSTAYSIFSIDRCY